MSVGLQSREDHVDDPQEDEESGGAPLGQRGAAELTAAEELHVAAHEEHGQTHEAHQGVHRHRERQRTGFHREWQTLQNTNKTIIKIDTFIKCFNVQKIINKQVLI